MRTAKHQFALCLRNTDYEASLIRGKVYPVLPDSRAANDALIRVIDEDGEDYLFPEDLFVLVDLPRPVEKQLLAIASVA
ncbi:MAG: hypothetical protein A3K19_22790 [Lentisphaerae bacterium RIFOXYB12_FULL_65_16]|nr:MAG: hypothetical protein A3K18_16965 [Lentisphaerae bacterium RIFOXYA12_64_32]OGV90038.1 MAG: hypothetical protein A3K19_22790 [Lentisphaerae bacterium RIFOXYB12_FULL_65_16]